MISSGQSLNDTPKYINLPETTFFLVQTRLITLFLIIVDCEHVVYFIEAKERKQIANTPFFYIFFE